MKKLSRHPSKSWLTSAAAGLATLAAGDRAGAMPWVNVSDLPLRRAATLDLYRAGFEHVLGTSLDITVEAARPSDAFECESRLLQEIERLRRILSTYDPASEISRVIAGGSGSSSELADLLTAYDLWRDRTSGLIDVNLGGVVLAWREAARNGQLPSEVALARAARRPRALNVDALGKAFIIDRAVEVARRFAPGGAVNLGGDIRVWGETAWRVDIADPRNPAENAPALATFRLQEAAVATSGGYARFLEVGGKRYSHLIDPRTCRPLEIGGSATVVAADCVAANALSTAASIGGGKTGAALAVAHGAKGYFLAAATGKIFAGGIFAAATATAPAASQAPAAVATAVSVSMPTAASEEKVKPVAAADVAWAEGFQVDIEVVLKTHSGNAYRIHRPYVAVWIQNAKGYLVRTVAAWGEDTRYQRKLSSWWNKPREGTEEPRLVARATRAPGAYTLVWDGKDDFGKRVPAGEYSVCVEICREDGHHVLETVAVTCGNEPVKAALRETAESNASTVSYGPKHS